MTYGKIASALLAVLLVSVTNVANAKTRAVQSSEIGFDRHNPVGNFYQQSGVANVVTHRSRTSYRSRRHHRDYGVTREAKQSRHKVIHSSGRGLEALTPALAAKARELVSACGARVISGYRPGARIAGSGHASLHARYPAEAVDMTGDTSCIYPRLKGWAGGYSVDYAAVRHIHISLAHDRREHGARFTHYGTRRYARRH